MKKLILLITLATLAWSESHAQKFSAYIETLKGETHEIKDRVEYDGYYATIYNKGEKKKAFSQKDLKMMFINNRLWIALPVAGEKRLRLHEIFAYNDKYIMTEFLSGRLQLFYIFDWDMKVVQDREHIRTKQFVIDNNIKPFFNECDNVMAALKSNLNESNENGLFGNMHAMKCGTKNIFDIIEKIKSEE